MLLWKLLNPTFNFSNSTKSAEKVQCIVKHLDFLRSADLMWTSQKGPWRWRLFYSSSVVFSFQPPVLAGGDFSCYIRNNLMTTAERQQLKYWQSLGQPQMLTTRHSSQKNCSPSCTSSQAFDGRTLWLGSKTRGDECPLIGCCLDFTMSESRGPLSRGLAGVVGCGCLVPSHTDIS